MPAKLAKLRPNRRLLRLVLRMPIWLYRARLGWLLGDRFLMLTHIGRKSGLPRQSVLEVVGHDTTTGTYVIASGWGEQADWYRNIQKTSSVLVDAGARRFEAQAARLPEAQAEQMLRDYARRHPFAFRKLGGAITGRRMAGTDEDYQAMARAIPFLALEPRSKRPHSS